MITMCATHGLARACHMRVTCILISVFKCESIKRLCVTEVPFTVVCSTRLNHYRFSIQYEAMDAVRPAPQEAYYRADDIYLSPKLGIKKGARESYVSPG